MRLSEELPEAHRWAMVEVRPVRLALAAFACLAVGFAFRQATKLSGDPGQSLYSSILWVQGLILLGYGGARAAPSVTVERSEGTWDLQRLTPQTGTQLFLGKLLGAPVMAYWAALLLTPWALGGAVLSAAVREGGVLQDYAVLLATAFFTLSACVASSAFADKRAGTSSAAVAGGALGLMMVSFLGPAMSKGETIVFYGATLGWRPFLTASLVVFGLWAAWAGRWRIGRDLLEPPGWGRMPAFALFLFVYQMGFTGRAPYAAAWAPWLACLAAAGLNPAPLEAWRAALATRRPGDFPVWVTTWAACGAASWALFLFGPRVDTAVHAAAERIPLLLTLFLTRDLCFLQWCRLTRSRHPEAMALFFIALAYCLPQIALVGLRQAEAAYFFAPVPRPGAALPVNLLPALVQAAGMAALLAATLRRRLA